MTGYACPYGDPPISYSFSYSYTVTSPGGGTCSGGGGGGAFSLPNYAGSVSWNFNMTASNAAGSSGASAGGFNGVGGGNVC